ncbi:MAG: DUF5687 family protein [Flavobacteriaceae bacterium]|nr:DUF5687 family protein [Flavobacteriaceae bacterium]
MIKRFFSLEWKAFFRSPSFQTNLVIKILMVFAALWVGAGLLMAGGFVYMGIEKANIGEPFFIINKFMMYYILFDLVMRYFMQTMPVVNIKPLLYLPLKKSQVVHMTLGKTALSYFNWTHAFFFIPLSVVLIVKGFNPLGVLTWHLAIFFLIYINNYLNILANDQDPLFYTLATVVVLLIASQYYGWFDVTVYTQPIFDSFYNAPIVVLAVLVLLALVYYLTFVHFKKHMYLDAGLASKTSQAQTEDFSWLNRFGKVAVFLKNDLRLILRNKRSKTTVLTSVMFLFYGLLFFTNSIEAYQGAGWKIFAGIFTTGGFLFTFGQYVPSWDSAYYPLMMSQNIPYKEYLHSKWYLVIIATIVSTILSTFYLYFGWEAWAAIIVGGIYNCGVNAYMVLWGGAYIKTPIDLGSNKKAFGDKQAFNLKTIILVIPKMVLPIIFYYLGSIHSEVTGFVLVALIGILGFAFKNVVFRKIEKIYKKEKYATLAAYKQKA